MAHQDKSGSREWWSDMAEVVAVERNDMDPGMCCGYDLDIHVGTM